MRSVLIFLFAMVLSVSSFAAEKTTFELRWTAPVERENGNVLAQEELKNFLLHVEYPTGKEKTYIIGPTARVAFLNLRVYVGDYLFKMQACDTDEVCSEYSNIVAKQVP